MDSVLVTGPLVSFNHVLSVTRDRKGSEVSHEFRAPTGYMYVQKFKNRFGSPSQFSRCFVYDRIAPLPLFQSEAKCEAID